MIQRPQTYYLLLQCILTAGMLPSALWTKPIIDTQGDYLVLKAFSLHRISALGEKVYTSYFPYLGVGLLALLIIGIGFAEILSYRNRKKQLFWGKINAILTLLLPILTYLLANKETTLGEHGVYQLPFFLPLAAFVFNFLASRSIRRDEYIIRSAERMR